MDSKIQFFLFPVHAWTRPEAARMLRLPHFMSHECRHMEVVRLAPLAQAAFTPHEIFPVLISVKSRGYSAAGRNMPMQNSNDPIGNRTRDLPACNAVPQPTALPRANVKIRTVLATNHNYNREPGDLVTNTHFHPHFT